MKLTYAVAVHWAMELLKGNPLPDYAPSKEVVLARLAELKESLDNK